MALIQRLLPLHQLNAKSLLYGRTFEIGCNLAICRHQHMGNRPTKRLQNPWIQRNTDFIKLLCIALVKHERIQTTTGRALVLRQYANLLVELSRRAQPPPDIAIVLENGFLLRQDEIQEKFKAKKMENRRWKKRVMFPKLSEDELVARCREEAGNILLQDSDAMDKLYGELRDRYFDAESKNFVTITKIPQGKNKMFKQLAYVEFRDNGLPPLPPMPTEKDD